MSVYAEDEYLQLSGIQHFAFCRRQWALIHVELQWTENDRTAEGRLMHERTHDPFFTEKRRDLIVTRDMAVRSSELGVSGQCDVVEFVRDDTQGVRLFCREGLWFPRPVEYKRGKSKAGDCDRLQLTAQAICLEEMLGCRKIEQGCLYYGETKRREYVDLSEELRDTVRKMFREMHAYFDRGYTPRVKATKSCKSCSLRERCLPGMPEKQGVAQYIASSLGEGTEP